MKKVLIVDDSQTFVMFTGLLLKRMGFETISARDGLEALKLMQTELPDALLLDITMPNMDGVTLLRQLRSDQKTADIPVIMTSVDASRDVVEKCTSLGCQGYLPKPVTSEQLHRALQDLIHPSG